MKMNLSKANTKAYIAAVLMATAFTTTSCGSDDPIVPPVVEPKAAVNILATVGSIVTKADAAYAPKDGKLYLYYNSVGSDQTATFAYASDQWGTSAPLFWEDLAPAGTAYSFFAIAPAAAATAAIASVPLNQVSAAVYTAADQLVAYTKTMDTEAPLPLAFKHILAQLKVTISSAVAATNPAYLDPASATLSIEGVRPAYTISYAKATSATPAVGNVSGGVATLVPNKQAGSFYTVVPAQSFAAGSLTLSFTIGGKPYTWRNETAISTVAAKNTVINLKVQKSGITLSSTGITLGDWSINGKPTDGDISFGK